MRVSSFERFHTLKNTQIWRENDLVCCWVMINFSSVLLIRRFEKLVSTWSSLKQWALEKARNRILTLRLLFVVQPLYDLIELNEISNSKKDKTKSKHQVKLHSDKDKTSPLSLLMRSPHIRVNYLLARRAPSALFQPPSAGQDWANKRVSGSDGGDGQWRPLRDALLSALIVAVIIICGRNCREAVRAYLQLSQKRTCSN